MLKKILIIGFCAASLTACAHSPLTAPCGSVSVASNGAGDCDPKPINYAALKSPTTLN